MWSIGFSYQCPVASDRPKIINLDQTEFLVPQEPSGARIVPENATFSVKNE